MLLGPAWHLAEDEVWSGYSIAIQGPVVASETLSFTALQAGTAAVSKGHAERNLLATFVLSHPETPQGVFLVQVPLLLPGTQSPGSSGRVRQ